MVINHKSIAMAIYHGLAASYFIRSCSKTVPVDTYCLKDEGLVKSFLRPETGKQLRPSKTAISTWKFIGGSIECTSSMEAPVVISKSIGTIQRQRDISKVIF